MKAIAARIDESVKRIKLSNESVGEKIGVRGESVRMWRKGKTFPRIDNIQALAEICNVDADWLLVGNRDGATPAFEQRHISLLKDYISLPNELKFAIRQTIEISAKLLHPPPPAAKKKLRKKRRTKQKQ